MSTNNLINYNNNNNYNLANDSQRIFDYFVVCGLPPRLTAQCRGVGAGGIAKSEKPPNLTKEEHARLLFRNVELESNKTQCNKLDPIVELAVLNKTLNESVPIGFEAIWRTPAGHSANLCGDAILRQNEMFLLFRRGKDKPPITDIGVFYDGSRETVLEGCFVIKKTVGENSANLNTSTFNADRVYVTYRRANELACNSLAVIDICVILKSKDEMAPHSFNEIQKSLNKSLLGTLSLRGPSTYICYKKSWISAPQIKYNPTILYKFPDKEHPDVPFPTEVASFGLPMGAVIESWPLRASTSKSSPHLEFNTFVLNVNSNDGIIMEKVYGSCIIFYENFDQSKLNDEQLKLLELNGPEDKSRTLHSNKCLILLSRHPLFETYRNFLLFLYDKYTKKANSIVTMNNLIMPIERYLYYLMNDVPFPTYLKPRILVNLTEKEEDCLSISLPNETILPKSGASFIELIHNLGVDNSIHTFLFALMQRNLMIHSLRKQVLTGVVEAISCIIFPFIWRYSYIPMCPLSLCELIEAPGSFIIGMDTRYFDLFDPPSNVICVDLDTNSISWAADRHKINLKLMPTRALNTLRTKLNQINKDIQELHTQRLVVMKNSTPANKADLENMFKKHRKILDLAIREAFLKFMVHILHNYKNFLRTVTRRPDIKAIDRNLSKFFDTEGFIRSKESSCREFYSELTKTQLFYDCVMNLSFTSELEPSLADAYEFFSQLCYKSNAQLTQSPHKEDDLPILELNELENNHTIVILPPNLDNQLMIKMPDMTENSNDDDSNSGQSSYVESFNSAFVYVQKSKSRFPPLKCELFVDDAAKSVANSALDLNVQSDAQSRQAAYEVESNSNTAIDANKADTQSNSSVATNNLIRRLNRTANTPIGIRTLAEKQHAQKTIESKLNVKITNNVKLNEKHLHMAFRSQAYCFLSNAYALWFIYLPEYVKDCGELKKNGLNYAYQVLIQMQKHGLVRPDEICFRVMMQLCLIYGFPSLAVKTLLHMRKYKIDITPITYSYYNKVMIESCNWPSFEQDKWARIRLTWLVVCRFRYNLKLKQEREKLRLKQKHTKSTKQTTGSTNGKNKNRMQRSKTYKTIKNQQQQPNVRKKLSLDDDSQKQQQQTIQVRMLKNNHENNHAEHEKAIFKQGGSQNWQKFNKISRLIVPLDQYNLLCLDSCGIVQFGDVNVQKTVNQKKPVHVFKSLNDITSIEVNFLNEKSHKKASFMTPITKNDPLGAFNDRNHSTHHKPHTTVEDNNIKKRLFDYKPFADTTLSQTTTVTVGKSDFIYAKQPPIVNGNVAQHKTQMENDSDFDTDDDYDEDEDEDEDEMELSVYQQESFSNRKMDDDDMDYDTNYDDEYQDEEDEDEDENSLNSDIEVDSNYFKNASLNGDVKSFNSGSTHGTSRDDNKSSIDIENIIVEKPKTENANTITSNYSLQMSPSILNTKVMSLMKRMGKTIDNSEKFKNVKDFLSEKTTVIKEVIMSNTHQQDIPSKLKSLSNYQIRTPLNGLVKSSTNAAGFSAPNSASNTNTAASSNSTQNAFNVHSNIDVENLPVDDAFAQLPLDWWGFDKKSYNVNFADYYSQQEQVDPLPDVLVDIQISSCNYCEKCKSFLYDEEIMSGWTLNDSDLNIKCPNCYNLLVPNLFIKIQDYDNIRKYLFKTETSDEEKKTNSKEMPGKEEEGKIDDDDGQSKKTTTLKSDPETHPFLNLDPAPAEATGDGMDSLKKRTSQLKINTNEFTVPYLSPLVLRKEFENIIVYSEKRESEECIIDGNFIKQHEVIFWNLMWYFKRIGVDTGHLCTVLLNSRLNALKSKMNERENDHHHDEDDHNWDEFKFKNFIPNQQATKKSCTNHSHVVVKCMWDNLKLKDETTLFEVPLYLVWLNAHYADVKSKNKLITVLSQNELKAFRKSNSNSRTLNKLFELVTRNIKESDVMVPFRHLLRERLRSKMNFGSIYRELLFLIITALERELIDQDAFDTEYREAYRNLISSELKDLIRKSDKPPNNLAVWCRRLFSPLLL